MSNPIWERFPVEPGLRCIEMKDQAQAEVMKEIGDSSPSVVVAYYHEAAHRFWRALGRPYPHYETFRNVKSR